MTENWIEFALGAVILLAPWVFGFADVPFAKWTDMLCGLALVLMNLWAIYGADPAAAQEAAPEAAKAEETAPAAAAKPRRTRRRAPAKASVTAAAGMRSIQKVENVF